MSNQGEPSSMLNVQQGMQGLQGSGAGSASDYEDHVGDDPDQRQQHLGPPDNAYRSQPSRAPTPQNVPSSAAPVVLDQATIQAVTAAVLAAMQAQAAATAPAQQPVAPSPFAFEGSHRKIKTKYPEMFTGKRDELRTFISAVRIYFFNHASEFQDEDSKKGFVASLLGGNALRWFEPYTRNPQASQIYYEMSMEDFFSHMMKQWGDIDESATATRKLRALRQTGSVSTYTSSFQQLASLLGWNDEALRSQFYTGLKEEVKDELSRGEPIDELIVLMRRATQIDNRHYERKLEKRATSGNPPTRSAPAGNQRPTESFNQAPPPAHPPYGQGDAMDLDANYATRGGGTRNSNSRGRLTAAEKKHRQDNNLCLYCGLAGHRVANCPTGSARRTQLNGTLQPASGGGVPLRQPEK
jgi:hypothetical protein